MGLTKAELGISYVLKYGVIICGILIALGLAMKIASYNESAIIQDQIAKLRSGQLIEGLQELASNSLPDQLIRSGILLLILLPIIRVGLTLVLFIIAGDYLFVVFTSVVFFALIASLIFKSN